MIFDNVPFDHLIDDGFLSFCLATTIIVSHRFEPSEDLQRLLYYLPGNARIIVVTNCPIEQLEQVCSVVSKVSQRGGTIKVVHQKDAQLARFCQRSGIGHILDCRGLVRDGKGEAMYIGTVLAMQDKGCLWVTYVDADNLVPAVILEYLYAFSKISRKYRHDVVVNARICWFSKWSASVPQSDARIQGRCSRVVSPLISDLCGNLFPGKHVSIYSSNSGEQLLSAAAALSLGFSSGYSVETCLLLELIAKSLALQKEQNPVCVLVEYFSQSPHIHRKKGDEHIKGMIQESLGTLLRYQNVFPGTALAEVLSRARKIESELIEPLYYPPIGQVKWSTERYEC